MTMTRPRVFLALALAAALLMSSCGDDASPFSPTTAVAPTTTATTTAAAATTLAPTTTAAPTTTTAPTTTVVVTTTAAPTTTAPPPCSGPGAGPIPASAEEVTTQTALLDADVLADEFSAYRLGDTWYLHARLGTGYATQLILDDSWTAGHWTSELGPVAVESARTFDSPEQLVVVLLNVGLVAEYGIFGLEDCALVALTQDDGRMPALWAGGSPGHIDRPICGPGDTVLQAVFGTVEGCGDIQTCPTPLFTATEYRVQHDPLRLRFISETQGSSTRVEMEEVLSRTCLGPG
jgi:hypothetical protein